MIGGLSLSNTVTAAVFERIRDFGIKRALGATDVQLLREVLGEALGVSLSGGALGVILALAIGFIVDTRSIRHGQQTVPVLAALARLRGRVRGHPGRARRRVRDASHRAPLAGRGCDPPRRLMPAARGVRASMLVRAVGLAKSFRAAGGEPIPVLTGVDLEAKPGEFVAIVGSSGSGKSTLLNLLGLLEPTDAGEIWFDDLRVSHLSRRAQARVRGTRIGYVFQSFLLVSGMTALDNVLLAARYLGRDRARRSRGRRAG